MAFKRVKELDEDDLLMSMRKTPQVLRIIEVKDLRESDSEKGGYFFYTSFENPETFQTFDMGFNIKMNDSGSLFVGSKSKLHPILSYASGIDEGIECEDFEDIRQSLEGLTFKAKTRREKFGNKKYFIIYPVDDDGEGNWLLIGKDQK